MDAGRSAPWRRRGLPRAFRCAALARVVPLWCALLIGLALPVVRMIHEDTHHHHSAATAVTAPLPQVAARDGDDDEGTCALCQLLAVAAGQHAVVHDDAVIQLPSAPIAVQSMPVLASSWVCTAAQQPPARGPPARQRS